MSKKGKSKPKEFLSDKISSLFTVAPSRDIEDDQIFGTKPKTVTKDELDSDNDLEKSSLSNFKKRNVALLSDLSNKYAGEVTTRKKLKQFNDDVSDGSDVDGNDGSDEDGSNVSDEEDVNVSNEDISEGSDVGIEEEQEENESNDELQYHDSNDEDRKDENSSDDDSSGAEGSEDGFDLSQMDVEESGTFSHFKETDSNEEMSKGNCVKNQLSLWENLLETRISMQKCLITANKMPLPETFQTLKEQNGEKFMNNVGKTKGNVTNLLNKLMDLQSQLLSKFSETKNLLNSNNNSSTTENKKSLEDNEVDDDDNEEIPSDSDSASSVKIASQEPIVYKKRKLSDLSSELSKRHTLYSKYRNSVIEKWHEKTKLSMVRGKNQPVTSTLSQIEYLLKDKNRLIKRTQLKRSSYDIVGEVSKELTEENINRNANDNNIEEDKNKSENDEYHSEIFDDDDFYHQLLRELIEHKSADISDPIQLSRQWISLQQMRSKMKRKIDTRATKGRRIRYAVHSKLVNFMAPQKSSDWTEEGKNELFASLFGKQFERLIESKSDINDDVDMKIF